MTINDTFQHQFSVEDVQECDVLDDQCEIAFIPGIKTLQHLLSTSNRNGITLTVMFMVHYAHNKEIIIVLNILIIFMLKHNIIDGI